MTHQPVYPALKEPRYSAEPLYVEPRTAEARRLLARGLAVVGLVGIALVHLVELPDTFRETATLGALFAILVVASAGVAAGLVHVDHTRLWQLTALVAVAPIAGYVLTRSVALPFDDEDVGNWLEPLGLVSLFIQASVLGLCAYVLLGRARD